MKYILTIGHGEFLLPNNAEFILNLSQALESLQVIRHDFDNHTYKLEPAEFTCEMLSEAAFARRYEYQPQETTDDDQIQHDIPGDPSPQSV